MEFNIRILSRLNQLIFINIALVISIIFFDGEKERIKRDI